MEDDAARLMQHKSPGDDERHGVGGDAFAAPDEAHALGGGGFDGDVGRGDAHDVGHRALHVGDVGVELGLFGHDGGVDVAQFVARIAEETHGAGEEDLAVDAGILAGGVGEVIADVAQSGGTEQGVADGVDEYVGVAMAEESEGVVDVYAADPQFTVGGEGVDVVSESDSHNGRG